MHLPPLPGRQLISGAQIRSRCKIDDFSLRHTTVLSPAIPGFTSKIYIARIRQIRIRRGVLSYSDTHTLRVGAITPISCVGTHPSSPATPVDAPISPCRRGERGYLVKLQSARCIWLPKLTISSPPIDVLLLFVPPPLHQTTRPDKTLQRNNYERPTSPAWLPNQ